MDESRAEGEFMFQQLHKVSANSLKTLVMKPLEENTGNASGHGIGKNVYNLKSTGGKMQTRLVKLHQSKNIFALQRR